MASIEQVEALIHEDVGRDVTALFAAAKFGLARAAMGIAADRQPRIGIMTGFFVPGGMPPSAETDGPAGAALLALGFSRIGLACRLITDEPCRSACQAALDGAGVPDTPIDVVPLGGDTDAIAEAWRHAGIGWIIAIERCGRSADGVSRNMRGRDLGAFAVPLDDFFVAGPWRTVAIGDGGNEIGMGSLPDGLIAAHVAFGARIACITCADSLIVAGVSHWGAYALLAALAILRPDWRGGLLSCLDPALDQRIVACMVAHGPAVDGVTLRREPTIDGIDMATHRGKLLAIRAVVGGDLD